MIALDQLESVTTIAAIFVGGFWAYYRFFKGRVLAPRVDQMISGHIILLNSRRFLVYTLRVANVGSSKVTFYQKGTGLTIYLLEQRPSSDFATSVRQKYIGVFDLLERQRWVEPGRTVQEEHMVALPSSDEDVAFRLECRVVYQNNPWFLDNVENVATAVVSSKNRANSSKSS